MSYREKLILSALATLVFISCNQTTNENKVACWGKDNYYDDFLWKKHIPDTLYRELSFDFNDDAKAFMSETLLLGIYKKSASGKMLPVMDNEIEVFADGRKCENNVISVSPKTELLKIGFVFDPQAENKVHHWFFKTVNDGGLDRINDMDAEAFNSDDSSLLEIEAEKNKVMNPLAKGTLFTVFLLVALLLLWLIVLKSMIFPTFRVGRIVLNDPAPYMFQKGLRNNRLLILTNVKKKQNGLNKFFTGRIIYDVNPMWTSDIIIEPRDKKSVRIKASSEYMVDSRILKTNQEYIIQNITTGTKTKIKIS